jgi:hypothetical protein
VSTETGMSFRANTLASGPATLRMICSGVGPGICFRIATLATNLAPRGRRKVSAKKASK